MAVGVCRSGTGSHCVMVRRAERLKDRAGAGDDRVHHLRRRRPEVELGRKAAQSTDERGTSRIDGRIVIGLAAISAWGSAVGSASCIGSGTGGGSAIAASGARPRASAIRPMAQCSVQAARSVAALSVSRFRRSACTRSSSALNARAWRCILSAWASHSRKIVRLARWSCARRRHSIACALAAAYWAARLASSALAGSSEATTGSSPVAGQGDRGVVAVNEILGCVGDRQERGAQRVDDLVVDVPGELESEVGLGVVHGRSMVLVLFTVKG
jgi:hypothetical protein